MMAIWDSISPQLWEKKCALLMISSGSQWLCASIIFTAAGSLKISPKPTRGMRLRWKTTLGMTRITLKFNLSRNIDAAALDVQAMIGKAARQLPPDLPTPPSYQKYNPADFPFFLWP
jgi:hypothetical protein